GSRGEGREGRGKIGAGTRQRGQGSGRGRRRGRWRGGRRGRREEGPWREGEEGGPHEARPSRQGRGASEDRQGADPCEAEREVGRVAPESQRRGAAENRIDTDGREAIPPDFFGGDRHGGRPGRAGRAYDRGGSPRYRRGDARDLGRALLAQHHGERGPRGRDRD